MLYWQVLDRPSARGSLLTTVGALVCWGGVIAALVIGLTVGGAGAQQVYKEVAPALAVLLIGVLLI